MDDHQSRPYLFLTQLDERLAGERAEVAPSRPGRDAIGVRR